MARRIAESSALATLPSSPKSAVFYSFQIFGFNLRFVAVVDCALWCVFSMKFGRFGVCMLFSLLFGCSEKKRKETRK